MSINLKNSKHLYLVMPVLAVAISSVSVIMFVIELSRLWYIQECCGPCEYRGLNYVLLVAITIILNVMNIVAALIISALLNMRPSPTNPPAKPDIQNT
jgi:hypothetical protein